MENLQENASKYRFGRLQQDVQQDTPLDVEKVAKILRDRAGMNNSNIGMGNEKAINQLIAHHSIIFKPSEGLVWVSTGPWQIGYYKCFDLKKIFHNFAASKKEGNIEDITKRIPPDIFLNSSGYRAFLEFGSMKRIINKHIEQRIALQNESSFISAFIHTNPEIYESWLLAGDYFYAMKNIRLARSYYYHALGCEIPRWQEKKRIIRQIAGCNAGFSEK